MTKKTEPLHLSLTSFCSRGKALIQINKQRQNENKHW